MSATAFVFDVKKFAVHDGPGIRTTFFLMNCPLHCLWCQNPESLTDKQGISFNRLKCIGCGECKKVCSRIGDDLMVDSNDCVRCGNCVAACVTGARHFTAKIYNAEMVRDEVIKEKNFFDASGGGVTFSGGECMIHPEFLFEALTLLKAAGINGVIDTCGYAPWGNFEKILSLADLFLYDIKVIDSVKHKQCTGVGNELILSNIEKLCAAGKKCIIRIPLIPGYTDSAADIAKTGEFILNTLRNKIVRVELLPYNKLAATKYGNSTIYRNGGVGEYPLKDLEPQSKEQVESLRDILASMGIATFAESL